MDGRRRARSIRSAEGDDTRLKFADDLGGELVDAVVFSDKLHYSPTSLQHEGPGGPGGAVSVNKATCCLIS